MRISVSFKNEEEAILAASKIINEITQSGTARMTFEVDGHTPDSTSNSVTIEFIDESNDEFEEPSATISQGD